MIFISHATNDDAFVDILADDLTIRGYQTWVDHKDMQAGAKWVAELEKALHESNVLILVLSRSSVQSSYVEAEWHTFFNLKRPIIPIRIDDCEVPLFLKTFHQISFRNEAEFYQNAAKLAEVLETMIGETQHTRGHERHASTIPDRRKLVETVQELMLLAEAVLDDIAPTLHAGNMMIVLPKQYEILQVPIMQKLYIGRSHNSLKHQPEIDLRHVSCSALASRQHAMLFFQGSQLFVQDLGSTNGTFLNGVELSSHEIYPVDSHSLLQISRAIPLFLRY